MKKILTLLLVCAALFSNVSLNAQYCGSSQVVYPACGQQLNFGFGDINTYKCITRGQCDTLTIPFKVYTGFTAQGNTITIYKLRFDAIDSLPCGLCWSTSQSAIPGNGVNEFSPGENGCIRITGLTNDAAGQYKLSMSLAVRDNPQTNNGYDIDTIPSDAGGVYLWIKVADPGNCPDTIITANGSAHPSTSCSHTNCALTGINTVNKVLTDLSIQPNPMTSDAKITFTSEIGGTQQIRITNIVGSEVYRSSIPTRAGINETTISRDNLPAGVYILSVGSNQGTATRKFVITD